MLYFRIILILALVLQLSNQSYCSCQIRDQDSNVDTMKYYGSTQSQCEDLQYMRSIIIDLVTVLSCQWVVDEICQCLIGPPTTPIPVWMTMEGFTQDKCSDIQWMRRHLPPDFFVQQCRWVSRPPPSSQSPIKDQL